MSGERPTVAALATWAVRAVFGLVVLVAALSILVTFFDIFIEARRQALRGLPPGGAVYQVILGSSRLTFAVAFALLIGGFCLHLFHLRT
jgi:hypothetical protein